MASVIFAKTDLTITPIHMIKPSIYIYIYFVNVEHVQVNFSQLVDEGMTECLARPHVGLQDVPELFDRLEILEELDVLRCLRNYRVPNLMKRNISGKILAKISREGRGKNKRTTISKGSSSSFEPDSAEPYICLSTFPAFADQFERRSCIQRLRKTYAPRKTKDAEIIGEG